MKFVHKKRKIFGYYTIEDFIYEHAWKTIREYNGCPVGHHERPHTTNMIERANQELKIQSRVVRVSLTPTSCLRLVTALSEEWHEDWVSGKVYLIMEHSKKFDINKRLQLQDHAPKVEPNSMTQKIITVTSQLYRKIVAQLNRNSC